jgi:hypothetical protein
MSLSPGKVEGAAAVNDIRSESNRRGGRVAGCKVVEGVGRKSSQVDIGYWGGGELGSIVRRRSGEFLREYIGCS